MLDFIPQSQLCELNCQSLKLWKEKQRRTYGWTHLQLINNRNSPTHLLRRRLFCKNGAVKIMCHFPTGTLNVSDGSIKPLSPQEDKELREHINSGHVKKSNLRKGCLLSEGPRKLHKRVRDVDKATHVLHIDIAGPYIESHEGHHYFFSRGFEAP